ncbi:Proprotein convertase subtilisin kexin type [Mactra antiquata]
MNLLAGSCFWIVAVFFLYCVCLQTVTVSCKEYLNKFAVHIPGGERIARDVAREGGYTLIGQIGSLEDHYLLEHPHVHRRSIESSDIHHQHLSTHPQVHWFEQQKLLTRKKRDFIEVEGYSVNNAVDIETKNTDTHNREKREINKQLLHFNDELYAKMWYFNGGGLNHTDMNVKGAWAKGVTGKDVVITILDDGLEHTHEDLKDNYDPFASYDVNGHKPDPMPRYDYTNENRHGTRCAGEVSAKANNTKCVVGVAYNSKIGGVRMLDGDVYDAVEATSLSHNRSHIDIYSASWGPDDDGRVVDGPGDLAKKAFIDGVRMGRGGKGSIFVWASGNGGNQKDSCNCDGYTNSIYTLSISSISQHGKKPWYLEECSSTLATTYSSGAYSEKQIVTVDLRNRCTETHTGTSASAPLAAGIVALILQVNPSLTWRDVQYITLMTARPMPDGQWITNGVGRQVSLRYGYGLMDATAMVELAEKWTNVPVQHICEVQSTVVSKTRPKVVIPDSGYEEVLDTDACAKKDNAINFLEHVQAKITLKSKRRGDLVIHLTSPAGTKSTILPQRPNDSDRMQGFQEWHFLSVHFWGENPAGHWKLEIEVKKNTRSYIGSGSSGVQSTNDLLDWSLILYGTEPDPVNLHKPTHPVDAATPSTTNGACHYQCLNGCTGPGADQCNACKNYQIQETGLCVETCPNEYYAESYTCKHCNETCETCIFITTKQIMCLKCKPGYLLVDGKGTCEKECTKGYFKDASNHHCKVCSGSCSECDKNKMNCTACRDGQVLIKNTCVSMKEPCAAGQYLSVKGCKPCPQGCFSCDSDTNCTCCNKGSYLQNGICVNSCDSGFQPLHVNYSSKFVFQQCQHCGDKCEVCPEGFNYIKGVCVQQNNCPEGTYFQWNSMSCKSCNTSCRSCIGPSNTDCLSCYSPSGYNNILRKCMRCCTNTQTNQKDCCQCIEDGKCELKSVEPPSQAEQLYSVATIIIVLLVVVICCLAIFGVFAIVISCRKKKSHPGVNYKPLIDNEVDYEDGVVAFQD